MLRAGAWYPVIVEVGGTLVLDVVGLRVILSSQFFEICDGRPPHSLKLLA